MARKAANKTEQAIVEPTIHDPDASIAPLEGEILAPLSAQDKTNIVVEHLTDLIADHLAEPITDGSDNLDHFEDPEEGSIIAETIAQIAKEAEQTRIDESQKPTEQSTNEIVTVAFKAGKSTYQVPTQYASLGSFSKVIRKMADDGFSRSQIAKITGCLYQHVRNVLTTEPKKASTLTN